MSGANSNGRQPNNTAYIKTFVNGLNDNLWKTMMYFHTYTPTRVLTPTTLKDVLIPGDLFLQGNLINTSDRILKDNISDVEAEITNKIMELKLKKFTYKTDSKNKIHYGFIAQEFEEVYNEMIEIKPDETYKIVKGINYLELIPLLVGKIQEMQKEIDELKTNTTNK